MSASVSGMRGGQPSTTQPIAAPWLSPKLVNRNIWPKVLNDIGFLLARCWYSGPSRRSNQPSAPVLPAARPLGAAFTFGHRRAEGLKQRAVDCVPLRFVLGVPLHAQGKARRIGNADRLDGAVFRHPLDHDALARLENALAVQRVQANGLLAEQRCKDAARH